MKKQFAALAAVCLLVVLGSVAYAHHPFAAEYDWTKPVTVTGTVSSVEWTNPHASLQIDGKDDTDQTAHWTFEMGSPGALTRLGWTRNALKMGDMVTVEGWRAKTGPNKGNMKSVKLSDGKELSGASSIGEIKKPGAKPATN